MSRHATARVKAVRSLATESLAIVIPPGKTTGHLSLEVPSLLALTIVPSTLPISPRKSYEASSDTQAVKVSGPVKS